MTYFRDNPSEYDLPIFDTGDSSDESTVSVEFISDDGNLKSNALENTHQQKDFRLSEEIRNGEIFIDAKKWVFHRVEEQDGKISITLFDIIRNKLSKLNLNNNQASLICNFFGVDKLEDIVGDNFIVDYSSFDKSIDYGYDLCGPNHAFEILIQSAYEKVVYSIKDDGINSDDAEV